MKKRILIIDDEKNIRLTLKQCFSTENYDIDVAINGIDGLNKLTNEKFDLALLDIRMPGYDGMEVLKEIRNKHIDISVIMMTAYGTIERAVDAMKLGAIDFISKPFTPAEIRSIVKEVLERETLVEEKLETYEDIIGFAKKCIIDKNYLKAEEFLRKSVALNIDSPEPHNLLGVLAEYRGDILKAQKHYRAALSLDPTYRPADSNLERITRFDYTQKGINLGSDTEKR